MGQAFLQVAIPVLYVYDEAEVPTAAPGFDMGLLPMVSRVLKDHAGTTNVTVITGAPAPVQAIDQAFTHLALQYPKLQKASPEAGNLIAAEFIADNFDADAVLEHLTRIVEERQRQLAEEVESFASRARDVRPLGEQPDVDEAEADAADDEPVGDEEPGDESKGS